MTTQTCVLNTPHSTYVWHHLHYRRRHIHSITPSHNLYDFTSTSDMTSHPVYLWHHIQYVRYHHMAFMTTQSLYMTSHPPYLTSQILYLCHHTDGTHICIDVSLYRWHPSKCVTHHTRHIYGIIPDLHHIAFTLYGINNHVLWHHKHCIHDIRSPLYDITSTL